MYYRRNCWPQNPLNETSSYKSKLRICTWRFYLQMAKLSCENEITLEEFNFITSGNKYIYFSKQKLMLQPLHLFFVRYVGAEYFNGEGKAGVANFLVWNSVVRHKVGNRHAYATHLHVHVLIQGINRVSSVRS